MGIAICSSSGEIRDLKVDLKSSLVHFWDPFPKDDGRTKSCRVETVHHCSYWRWKRHISTMAQQACSSKLSSAAHPSASFILSPFVFLAQDAFPHHSHSLIPSCLLRAILSFTPWRELREASCSTDPYPSVCFVSGSDIQPGN